MRRPILHNVQVLRFVAAAGVVIGHAADRAVPDQGQHWFWSVPWTYGVDLFFVISGFIMAYLTRDAFGRPGAAAEFLKRRAIRIIPPYWFFTTLTIAAVMIMGGRLGGTTVDPGQIVTSYSFLPWPRLDGLIHPIVSQGWTLNYEAFFYLAFAAALLTRRGLLWLCAAFVMLALLHRLVPPSLFMLKFWSRPIIVEFVGGIALAQLYFRGIRLAPWGSLLCAALAVILYLLPPLQLGGGLGRLTHVGVPAVVLSAGFILGREPERPGAVRRFLELGGDASYAIYLSHYMLINVILLVWAAATGGGMPWLGTAVASVLALAAGIIFYLLVEKPATARLQDYFGVGRPRPLKTVAL